MDYAYAVMRRMQEIAHVDVNCFYASAERAFNPALEGKPVIVLSSNYELYGDINSRVIELLARYSALQEVYFLYLQSVVAVGGASSGPEEPEDKKTWATNPGCADEGCMLKANRDDKSPTVAATPAQ
jgi:hypothetical protein